MNEKFKLYLGDSMKVLRELPENSIDSVVTDPPYHLTSIVKRFGKEDSKAPLSSVQKRFSKNGAALSIGADGKPTPDQYGRLSKGFMGKTWDGGDIAFRAEFWAEVLRVLKPGGHLIAFSGSRTYHRMACAIEDCGFEIRDQLQWIYGSGFPKNHNVSKNIDKNEFQKWNSVYNELEQIEGGEIKKICLEYLLNVKNAEKNFQVKKDQFFVGANVLLKVRQKNKNAIALIAELLSSEALHSLEGRYFVQENAEENLLQNSAKFAEEQNQSDRQKSMDDGFVLLNVQEFLKEKTERITKAEEALMILLGKKKSLNHQDINALCAELIEGWKHTILNLSKIFQNLDIQEKMECASAITAIITESMVENLISNMVDILKNKIKDRQMKSQRKKVKIDAGELKNPPNLVGGVGKGDDRPWRQEALEKGYHEVDSDDPATEEAALWNGWGSALKPAHEPMVLARKPMPGSIAQNVLDNGTGALNIDGCRVGDEVRFNPSAGNTDRNKWRMNTCETEGRETVGRWPSNVIIDGSEEVTRILPADAARFFYCPKASKEDRDEGNSHPTVKPVDLMRYLCRLITPPGGLVLDPFMGSGSTGKAAMLEFFQFVGIDLTPEYYRIAEARIKAAAEQPKQTSLF